jgi:hypothetical protein
MIVGFPFTGSSSWLYQALVLSLIASVAYQLHATAY